MAIAPEPVLRAGLATLHWATVVCRNWTLHKNVPLGLVNDLMEAIHEIPEFLADFERAGPGMETLFLHLSCFDPDHWRSKLGDRSHLFDVPDLVVVFKDRLERFSKGDD